MATFLARPEKALQGAKALDQQLKNLEDPAAARVLRGSIREALRPTLALWRASMRVGTRRHKTYKGQDVGPGFSRKNSYIASSVARDRTTVSGTISYKAEAFYNLYFIETTGFRGGRGRRDKRKGRDVSPVPKLIPAFRATRGAMLQSLVAALRKRIAEAVRKGANTR